MIQHPYTSPDDCWDVRDDIINHELYEENKFSAISKLCKALKIDKKQAEALGYCIAWSYFEDTFNQEAKYMTSFCDLDNLELAALISEAYFECEYNECKND